MIAGTLQFNLIANTAGLVAGMAAATAAVAAMTKASIDAMDAVSKMSQRIGVSVEALQKLNHIASLSDVSAQGLANAFKKLSVGMAEGTKETEAAFKALGVATRTSTGALRDSEKVFQDIAEKFSEMEDGAGKTALAVKLFGKAGADMIPLLNGGAQGMKDAAEEAEKFGLILSGDTLKAAEAFNDNLTKLGSITRGTFNQIAEGTLPVLVDFTNALVKAATETESLNQEAQRLNKDGSITSWAEEAAIGVGRLIDVLMVIPNLARAVGGSFEAVWADVKLATTALSPGTLILNSLNDGPGLKGALDERNKIVEAANKRYDDLWNKPADTMSRALQDAFEFRKSMKAIAEQYSAEADYLAGAVQRIKAPDIDTGKVSEFAKLMTKLQGDLAKSYAEAESATKNLTKAETDFIALQRDKSGVWATLSAQQKSTIAGIYNQISAEEKRKKAFEEQARSIAESNKLVIEGDEEIARIYKSRLELSQKAVDDAIKEAEANERLVETFDMSKSAIEAMEVARLEERLAQRASTDMTSEEITELEKLIDAKKRSAAAVGQLEMLEQQKKLAEQAKQDWEDLDRTAQDTFRSIFTDGDDAFRKLGDSLKNHLIDLLYQMTVRQWIFQIGANVAGTEMSGMSGGGGGLIGTSMQAYSMYNQASNLYGAVSGWFGAGASTGAAATALSSSASIGMAAGSGLGVGAEIGGVVAAGAETGIASGIASGLAAVPVWGWIALAAVALFSAFGDDGPEQSTYFKFGANKEKGDFSVNARGNEGVTDYAYVGNRGISSAFGTFGVSETFWGNDKQLPTLLDALKRTEDTLAGLLTNDEIKRASEYINTQGDITVGSGPEGADTSAAMAIVFAKRIEMIFEGVETGLSDLVSGFAGNSEQLAQEAATLLSMRNNLAAYSKIIGEDVTLQSMAALKVEGESSAQAISRVVTTFQMTNDVAKMFGVTIETAFGDIGLAGIAAREELVKAAGGLEKFAAQSANYYANFFTDEQRKNNLAAEASATLNEAFGKLGVAVPKTHEEFSKLMASYLDGTEAGTAAYQAVMNVSGAFAQVHGTAQQAAEATAQAAQAFQSASEGIFASIARLSGASPTNTALTKLGGMNADWGSIANLMTITPADLEAIRKANGQATVDLINQALSFAASNMSQSSSGPLELYQGTAGSGTTTIEETAAALPTHALEIELLRLQGRALEALNLQRQDELQSLSDSDKALKEQIYVLQDAQKIRDLGTQLLQAEGLAYEATARQREDALRLLTAEQAAIQQQIYDAQDAAKTAALQVQIETLLGDSGAALAATRAKELAALSPTDRALQEQIYRLQDQAKAAKSATDAMSVLTRQMDAVASLKSSIQQSISQIRPDTAGALASAQAAMAKAMGGSIDDRLKAAGTLQSAIMAQYQEQMSAAQNLHQEQSAAQQAAIAAANQLNAAYRKLGEYAQSLLVGNLSVLSPEQKLAEARSQYQTTLAAAQAGDAKAAESLQGFAQTYLEQARGFYASNMDYVGIFTSVQGALATLGMAGPDQVFQENSIALQTELASIQTGALEQLTALSALTDTWQAELQSQLEEQAISFSELNLNTAQVAANTDGLDQRIGAAVAAALAARDEATVAAINAQTEAMARLAELTAEANERAVEQQTAALKQAPAVVADRR